MKASNRVRSVSQCGAWWYVCVIGIAVALGMSGGIAFAEEPQYTQGFTTDQGEFAIHVVIDPPEAGSVIIDPDRDLYPEGMEVEIRVIANPGYGFVRWESPAYCYQSYQNPLEFDVLGSVTFTAVLENYNREQVVENDNASLDSEKGTDESTDATDEIGKTPATPSEGMCGAGAAMSMMLSLIGLVGMHRCRRGAW